MSEVTSLRNTWEFRYRPSEVLDAAQKRLAHHKERLDWWQKEMSMAEKELKEKGFEYREEHRSMGADLVIVGDPQLAKRVSDCRRKISEHQQSLNVHETWVRALRGKAEREPKTDLILKIEDVVFFGL
jgi:hypothetical protein